MALYIRMALYFVLPSLGTVSWLGWDPQTGIATVHVDGLAQALAAYLAFAATFVVSRIAKRRGGAT